MPFLCGKNKVNNSPRHIYPVTLLELKKIEYTENPNLRYASNEIRTTKYTFWTFLPLNLWEQFHRFANVYFILILILNFMPYVNAFAKEVAPIPVFFALAVVAIKDAYEDFRRHLSDRQVNQRLSEVFSVEESRYILKQWKTIRPGDFLRLHTNDVIPADVLLLWSSNSAGICHIETSNIDGESNLKQREIVQGQSWTKRFSPFDFYHIVEVEAPSAELYKFHGKIKHPEKFIPIRKANVLLRGCVLRNTDFVEGLVIYAGKETKSALNNTGVRFKRSKLESSINIDVIWCVLILIIVCVTGAIGSAVWHQNLPYENVLFAVGDRNSSTDTPAFQGFINFWRFLIIFQSIIPLTLYVTLEVAKLHQVWHIHNDLNLYDAVNDRRIQVRAFNIPEDLGQIEYVFCDKTGTLTENKMELERACINGIDYLADEGDGDDVVKNSPNPSSKCMACESGEIHLCTGSSKSSNLFKLHSIKTIIDNTPVYFVNEKPIESDNNNHNQNCVQNQNRNSVPMNESEDSNLQLPIHRSVDSINTTHNGDNMINSNFIFYQPNQIVRPIRTQEDNVTVGGCFDSENDRSVRLFDLEDKSSPSLYSLDKLMTYTLGDEDVQIQNFVLALAICNTAVVSVTKNTPTPQFQMPEQSKRSLFKKSSSNSAVQNGTSVSRSKANHSQPTSSTAVADENRAKQSFSLSSLFTKSGLRSFKNQLNAIKQSDKKQYSSTENQLDENCSDNTLIESLQTDDLDAQNQQHSSTVTTTTTKVMTNSADDSCGETVIENSNVLLPPVIKAIDFHIPTSNLFQTTIDKQKNINETPSCSMNHLDVPQYTCANVESDTRSCPPLELELDNTKQYDESQGNNLKESTTKQTQLIMNMDNSIRSNNNNSNNNENQLSARTLTVIMQNGCSYELPVESDVGWTIDSGLNSCPLSDQTLLSSYETESPDELCLVKTACRYGYKLLQRGIDFLLLWLPKDKLVCLNVVRILPFDSIRKRMSIIIRHPVTNAAILYTKGADSAIFNRLSDAGYNQKSILSNTKEHVDNYAHAGLRTLVVAMRYIPEDELANWLHEIHLIETEYPDPTEPLRFQMDKLENDLFLLGATGIVDRLQEDVPDTIQALRDAGMKVWVLTGDKQETAVNIAYSANLIGSEHKVLYINLDCEIRAGCVLNTYLYGILSGQYCKETEIKLDVSDKSKQINRNQIQTNNRIVDLQRKHIKRSLSEMRSHYHHHQRNRSAIHSPDQSNINIQQQKTAQLRASSLPRNFSSQNNPTQISRLKLLCTKLKNSMRNYQLNLLKRRSIKRFKTNIPLKKQFTLVIDGESLSWVLAENNRLRFLKLTQLCNSVICCRSTPGQKADVVKLIRDDLDAQTLAIGDGANDLHMIQTANIGIGMFGEEGMQAVMASDFAIGRFRFLKRLLLVHGHCCYSKLAHASLYLFYKNAVYIFTLFWFQMFNGFSGSNTMDQLSQILFCVTFTGLPPIVMGIWDNPLDQDTLLANPIIYQSGIEGKAYAPHLFWISILDALWQSLIIFFLSYLCYADGEMTLWRHGVFHTNALVLCAVLTAALVTRSWVVFHWISFVVSYVICYLVFTMIYHLLAVRGIHPECPYFVIFKAMGDAHFWFLTFVTIYLALLPRILIVTVRNMFFPTLDTMANNLAKIYGRGKCFPLKFYLSHTLYSNFTSYKSSLVEVMSKCSLARLDRNNDDECVYGLSAVNTNLSSPQASNVTKLEVPDTTIQQSLNTTNDNLVYNNNAQAINDYRRRRNLVCIENMLTGNLLEPQPIGSAHFDDGTDDWCKDGGSSEPKFWPAVNPNKQRIRHSLSCHHSRPPGFIDQFTLATVHHKHKHSTLPEPISHPHKSRPKIDDSTFKNSEQQTTSDRETETRSELPQLDNDAQFNL